VFLLPVQLDVLRVPSPSATPTNLLFNLVAAPGALWRYWRAGVLDVGLTGRLLLGTVRGVVIGSLVRVYARGPGVSVVGRGGVVALGGGATRRIWIGQRCR
jgi:uncharacterized membrane protein YfcA